LGELKIYLFKPSLETRMVKFSCLSAVFIARNCEKRTWRLVILASQTVTIEGQYYVMQHGQHALWRRVCTRSSTFVAIHSFESWSPSYSKSSRHRMINGRCVNSRDSVLVWGCTVQIHFHALLEWPVKRVKARSHRLC